LASLVRGSWSPGCGAPRQGGSSIDPPIPLVLTIKHHEIDDDPLLFRELSTSYDGPLFSNFFEDAASFSCEQLIRSLKSGFSESHLRGRWCSSVFLPIDRRDFLQAKWSSLLLLEFNSTSTTFAYLCSLVICLWASSTLHKDSYYDLSVPGQGGCLWAASRSIKTPPRSARGLPLGSRPNTAPGLHAHSRPAPTNRWDLHRF
jgi:hypothetical protein